MADSVSTRQHHEADFGWLTDFANFSRIRLVEGRPLTPTFAPEGQGSEGMLA